MMTIWGSLPRPPPSVFIISGRRLVKTSIPEWLLTFSEPPRFHPQPVFPAYFWLVSLLLKEISFPSHACLGLSACLHFQTSPSPCPTSETHPWEPWVPGLSIFPTATQQDTDQMFHSILQPPETFLEGTAYSFPAFLTAEAHPAWSSQFVYVSNQAEWRSGPASMQLARYAAWHCGLALCFVASEAICITQGPGPVCNCHVVILTSRG